MTIRNVHIDGQAVTLTGKAGDWNCFLPLDSAGDVRLDVAITSPHSWEWELRRDCYSLAHGEAVSMGAALANALSEVKALQVEREAAQEEADRLADDNRNATGRFFDKVGMFRVF